MSVVLRRLNRTISTRSLVSTVLLLANVPVTSRAAEPVGCNLGGYFTDKANSSGPGTASYAGTPIVTAEASTSQAIELVALRRNQEAEACPAGSTRVGGVCQPIRRAAEVSEREQVTRRSEPSRQPVRPVTQVSKGSERPIGFQMSEPERFGVWSEVFGDYERRTGLGTSDAPASRSQRTAGLLVGADRT